MAALPITVFADFTCPGCHLTEAALRRCAAAADVAVRYRAAELEPLAETLEWQRELAGLADALGLPLNAPPLWPRSAKPHEASALARERGDEGSMRAAIYRAFWEEGLDIGRIDVLQELAPAAGLDPFDLKVALDIDRYREEVLRDQEVARRLGIRHGPVLYLGTGPGARILIGPQTEEQISTAIMDYELRITTTADGAGESVGQS